MEQIAFILVGLVIGFVVIKAMLFLTEWIDKKERDN
jgi:hypothetical protein